MTAAKSKSVGDDPHQTLTTESVGIGMADSGRLIAVSGARIGSKYTILDEVTLGRGGDCNVVVDNAECSRQHARIRRKEDGFFVTDLGSRNGTLVNGQRIDGEHRLSFGDRLRIGPKDVFLFTPHDPVEEQILHRQRLETLGRLTAGISHDLNNMLGAIKASIVFMQELPQDARSGDDADDCLNDISVAAARATDLAGRLLSFAQPSGTHTIADMSEIVNEAIMLARRTFDRTVDIDANVAPGMHVEGDATQLHQVLMNLLVNARDAIHSKGQIRISALPKGEGRMLIIVQDGGCGMDAETQAKMFEPFYTTKRPGAGFGVGLATVADIVQAHGGSIAVDSSVDIGSTFTISLPVATPPTERQAVATLDGIRRREGAANGLRVTLVDDEPVLRRSLARVFRHAGFDVMTFETGEAALEALDPASNWPDVMVLDLDLPGITGEETLRRLRTRDAPLPVVCISGHHAPSRKREVIAIGAAAFLGKPFEPATLVAAALAAVESAQQQDDTTPEP